MGVIQITDWRINGFNPDYAIKILLPFSNTSNTSVCLIFCLCREGFPMSLKSLFWQHSVVKWQSITLRWRW